MLSRLGTLQTQRWPRPSRSGYLQRITRYHLRLLDLDKCRPAITEPAAKFGIDYEDAALDSLLGQLAKEDTSSPGSGSIPTLEP